VLGNYLNATQGMTEENSTYAIMVVL
jgi:hypothetical protein